MENRFKLNVCSEIGELEGVILHTPGAEIENMTPENAERALYSDILNLSVASQEYDQLSGVLGKLTQTYQVKELLTQALESENIREKMLRSIAAEKHSFQIYEELQELSNENLANALVEGLVMKNDSLTNFLSKQRYSLRPLHNFFFTRDASVSVNDKVLLGKMANGVRDREARIMKAIFSNPEQFNVEVMDPKKNQDIHQKLTVEGGDVLIARDDVLVVGIGARTTPQGVDYIISQLKKKDACQHIIVQELPFQPESFIHLDMVFTFLDVDKCMVYDPVILKPNRLQTVSIRVDHGKVKIKESSNLIEALEEVNISLKPVFCGGKSDAWIQKREQWHSGANFFAIAPGKVIGYGRNVHTIEELSNNGFEVLKAVDVIQGKTNPADYKSCVITIEGSELSRGGGGARCMTMPVARKAVPW